MMLRTCPSTIEEFDKSIEQWIHRSAVSVLVRGESMKSEMTTRIEHMAHHLHKNVVKFSIDMLLDDWDTCSKLLNYIKSGFIVIVHDMHLATTSLQIMFQELLDNLSFQSMMYQRQWHNAGVLFLTGPDGEVIRHMFYNNKAPLYQRVVTTLIIPSSLDLGVAMHENKLEKPEGHKSIDIVSNSFGLFVICSINMFIIGICVSSANRLNI